MNDFIIRAGDTELNTFDDISVSLNYQIDDILDIEKRNTNFSKTITLPGNPNNNLFFKQIFDVNIDNIKAEDQQIPIVSMSVQDIYAHYLVPEENSKITIG